MPSDPVPAAGGLPYRRLADGAIEVEILPGLARVLRAPHPLYDEDGKEIGLVRSYEVQGEVLTVDLVVRMVPKAMPVLVTFTQEPQADA